MRCELSARDIGYTFPVEPSGVIVVFVRKLAGGVYVVAGGDLDFGIQKPSR